MLARCTSEILRSTCYIVCEKGNALPHLTFSLRLPPKPVLRAAAMPMHREFSKASVASAQVNAGFKCPCLEWRSRNSVLSFSIPPATTLLSAPGGLLGRPSCAFSSRNLP